MRVEFVKDPKYPNAKMPVYADPGASGADLFAPEDVEVMPFKATLVHTGLIVAYIPPGYEIQVRARSGNAPERWIKAFAENWGSSSNTSRLLRRIFALKIGRISR